MSDSSRATSVAATSGLDPTSIGRRVRHQARDALVVMTFSLATSAGLALALLLMTLLLQPGR